jgi:hypothetical protein
MKNRKKVILHRRDGWGDDRKLALTDDQISLLNWLADRDLIDNDTWDIQVLEDAENWEEV